MQKDRQTLRKKIINKQEAALPSAPVHEELDIARIATVHLTSESSEFPIENAFDEHSGPGGTHWIAPDPGDQVLILQFDVPQTIHEILMEAEELEVSRTQEVELFLSSDSGSSYREVLRQEYNFSPPGTTFEREIWSVPAEGVTHLRIEIKPDKAGKPYHANLISLALR
jgi:hypothetical protein